jgi:hypothetical protein
MALNNTEVKERMDDSFMFQLLRRKAESNERGTGSGSKTPELYGKYQFVA